MSDLTGKVAIVTGGAQGIGAGISDRMAVAGAKVLVADLDLETANETVDAILETGGIASAIKTDVNSYQDLRSMVDEAQSLWGTVDVLVNNAYNAADGQQGGALEVTEERWERDMHALVTSVYAGSKYRSMTA